MPTNFIYLASSSPRRRELLDQIGVPYRAVPADLGETRQGGETGAAYVERIATTKADQVWERMAVDAPAPVLAADTAVIVDGEIFGKPRGPDHALEILDRLSGRSHTVLTAVALRWRDERELAVASSEVRFRATTAAERMAYCRSREPLDKAGAYAIQGLGAVFIEHLAGSYSTVMGLPLFETVRLLSRFGLPPWLEGDAPAT